MAQKGRIEDHVWEPHLQHSNARVRRLNAGRDVPFKKAVHGFGTPPMGWMPKGQAMALIQQRLSKLNSGKSKS